MFTGVCFRRSERSGKNTLSASFADSGESAGGSSGGFPCGGLLTWGTPEKPVSTVGGLKPAGRRCIEMIDTGLASLISTCAAAAVDRRNGLLRQEIGE
jgi:hypothetical protein